MNDGTVRGVTRGAAPHVQVTAVGSTDTTAYRRPSWLVGRRDPAPTAPASGAGSETGPSGCAVEPNLRRSPTPVPALGRPCYPVSSRFETAYRGGRSAAAHTGTRRSSRNRRGARRRKAAPGAVNVSLTPGTAASGCASEPEPPGKRRARDPGPPRCGASPVVVHGQRHDEGPEPQGAPGLGSTPRAPSCLRAPRSATTTNVGLSLGGAGFVLPGPVVRGQAPCSSQTLG